MRKRISTPVRHEQAALVKTIGDRMRQARELCNLSQQTAAQRLGYQNSTKLSKVERATDTNSIPLWLIARAAKIYEVSVDFLFGASGDWDTGARMTQEREVSGWLFAAWDEQRRRDMLLLRRLHDRQEAIAKIVGGAHESAARLEVALKRFKELNPEFDSEMRGSATLDAAVRRSIEVAEEARTALQRFKVECRLSAYDQPTLESLISEKKNVEEK